MEQLTCPNCGKAFTIDEAGYADLVKQVRDDEFAKALHERLEFAESEKRTALELVESRLANEAKDASAAQAAEIARLKSELKASDAAQKSAVDLAEVKVASSLKDEAAKKDAEIQRLKGELTASVAEKQFAVTTAVNDIEKQRDALARDLEARASEQKLLESALKESHSKDLQLKDEQIAYYRDFKAKQSVKLMGESLEQHCEIEFGRVRAMAFPDAKFEKDNDASGGSKGDYIYRDFSEDDIEFISIMFEMKNEADESTNKKKNADHFAKLDKDRKEKGCEYAVLVSMLEGDSELYTGITPVHGYDKMFVVRPQFFLGIITLLRNAARETIRVKAELELTKQQNIDITNFEVKLRGVQTSFGNTLEQAGKQYDKAVKQIDDTIKGLEGLKESLRLWLKHLSTANGKIEGLSVKQLTRGNDTMKAKFDELGAQNDPEAG